MKKYLHEDNVNIQKKIYLGFKNNMDKLQNKQNEFPLDPMIGRSTVCHTVMDNK